MTNEEKIEVLDVISDVFLETNNHFKTELQPEQYSHFCIDVESEYDKIVNGIHTLKDMSFKITSRVTAGHNYKNMRIQRSLSMTGVYIVDKFPHLEKRISTLLPNFTIKYRKFIMLAFEKGLVILPLFEIDKEEIEEDSYDRMSNSGYNFSSYEKNIREINRLPDVQIGHIMLFIEISKPSPIIKKIKRFKWF